MVLLFNKFDLICLQIERDYCLTWQYKHNDDGGEEHVFCYSVQLLITHFVTWLNSSRHFKLARTATNTDHTARVWQTTAMVRHVRRRDQKPIHGGRSTLKNPP